MIMLIVLVCMAAAGYLWYAHARSVRIQEERTAKVVASEKKIVIYEDEIKKLAEDKNPFETETNALDAKIKEASEKLDASTATLKTSDEQAIQFRKKMDDTRRAIDQYNRELAQKNRDTRSKSSQGTSQISSSERNLTALQKELEKVNCHYNCMGRSRSKDKARPSDDGVWVFDNFHHPLYWKCKKHGYMFTYQIGYLDYKNEVSRLSAEIGKCQRQIAELKQSAGEQGGNQQSGNQTMFDSAAWNTKYNEYREAVTKAQSVVNNDRKELDKLNSEKRKLDSKLQDIDRKIENNESQIKNERLLIADNQK